MWHVDEKYTVITGVLFITILYDLQEQCHQKQMTFKCGIYIKTLFWFLKQINKKRPQIDSMNHTNWLDESDKNLANGLKSKTK